MDELPDEYLAEILLLAKKIAKANGLSEYNILQVRHPKSVPFSLIIGLSLPRTMVHWRSSISFMFTFT
jgi:hypothetical protein